MTFDLHLRRGLRAVPCALVLMALFGCGGGGGGGGGPVGPGPTPAVTSIPRPQETVVVPAGGNINDAVVIHPAGATIIVEGGVYEPIVINPGTVFGPIFIEAGSQEFGSTVIIGEGETAGVYLNGQTNVVLDGLQIIGGEYAGIYAVDSDAIEVRNCVVRRANYGAVFDRVSSGLMFDTLFYDNAVNGVMALGTSGFRAINNTIFGSEVGLFVGSSSGDAVAVLADDTFVQNNIFDGQESVGIRVEAGSEGGYFAGYNLNRTGYQGVSPGFRDLNADPAFIFPPGSNGDCITQPCNFRVQVADGGRSSAAIDRGDPDTDPLLVDVLRERTITINNFADGGIVDLGYHYPGGMSTPTPFPTTTPTAVPQ